MTDLKDTKDEELKDNELKQIAGGGNIVDDIVSIETACFIPILSDTCVQPKSKGRKNQCKDCEFNV
ncbi:MAG: hypothetical protein Q4E33_04410 [Erysipelotrichaceae bacterium]|nr:hypothetical protein [Erysipelotrichaceae bacterium]